MDLFSRCPVRSLIFAILAACAALCGDLQSAEKGARKRGGAGGGAGAKALKADAPQWWREIDTGPFISDTFQSQRDGPVAALKGIAIKVGAARDATLVFDTELLAWRAGFEGAVLLEGSPWGGGTGNSLFPEDPAALYFLNAPALLGFAVNGNWNDSRPIPSGPLPRNVGRYQGLFRHGNEVVVHYQVGGVSVLEHPALEVVGGVRALTRTVNVAATSTMDLELLVSDPSAVVNRERLKPGVDLHLVGAPAGVTLKKSAEGRTTVAIARGTPASRFKIAYAEGSVLTASFAPPQDLSLFTKGGPPLFAQTFAVKGQLEVNSGVKTYAVDAIPLPADNPWKSPPRFGGFDFLPGGNRIAASTWNGDVWIAEGIAGDLARVTWRRFASGMFQTLGLKVVDGVIYTQGRDQITRLHDLNGDGEADHYECFNNDVMITHGFHEFSFDLQTDRDGNFYFSKAMPVNPGGRGFMPATPHNGTVMKVSKDGAKLEVVAWGLRAPGGVGVSPDGIVTTGENEGSWVPACKISWTRPGSVTFNGVVPSKWENRNVFAGALPGAPTDYDRPLMWLPYYADNSSGSQVWVPENTTWDPRHAGEMLHLSYGKSSIFRVLREEVNGVAQGTAYRLPIDVSAAVMRARFHPQNGQLYLIGFRGWQTNGRDAFQRVRYTGKNTPLPTAVNAHANGLVVRFSAPLDRKTAEDPARYAISKWNYVWGPMYGSGRFSIDQRDAAAEARALTAPSKAVQNQVDVMTVGAARLLEDGQSVFLYLPKMTPAMQLELKLDLMDRDGTPVRETLYSTVHQCASEFKLAGVRWEDIAITENTVAGEQGLVMSFDAETTDAVRVDQLALQVPAGASASVFIAPREFGAAWQGSLIVPERDAYQFYLDGVGTASLQIDGKVIASGTLPLAASAPLTLAKGSHALYASYSSLESGEGRIRLEWSSSQFRREPVPASVFRHLPGAELAAWSNARAGRETFVAAHCIKCHQPRTGIPTDAPPDVRETVSGFRNIGGRIERAWLQQWIAQPQGRCPSVAPERAADIAAHLATVIDGEAGAVSIPADPASVAAGAELIAKLRLDLWIRPLLSERKHTDRGLVGQLLQPALHHPDTAFPDVRLTRGEALQIAAYVRSNQPPVTKSPANGDPLVGRAAVIASCAACHEPAATAPRSRTFEEIARADWAVKGCVSVNRGAAPDLRLSADEVKGLLAFRNADRDVGLASLRRFAPMEYAATRMKALQCAHCHTPTGDGKVPDISLAGEKFTQRWLVDLLSGKHPKKTRPWLESRMPAFASRAASLAAGLAAKHGMPTETEKRPRHPELAVVGAKLSGEGGYACIACHGAGARQANQVFEGQGPNLQSSGQRLRYDYFQRWMHWPQRIAPQTIMPRYTKDREHAVLDTEFDGVAEKQFEAIWHWMQGLAEAP